MITRLQLALGLLVDPEQLDLYRDRTLLLPTHENIRKWNSKIHGDVVSVFHLQQKWFLEQLRYAQVAMSIFSRRFVLHACVCVGGVVAFSVFFNEASNLYNEIKWCSDGAEANMICTAQPILADQEKYLKALKAFDHFSGCYREQFATIEAEIAAMINFLRALAKFDVLTRLHNLMEDFVLQKTLKPFSRWLYLLLTCMTPDHKIMQAYEEKFPMSLYGYSPEAIDAYIRHYEMEHRSAA